jgi:AcrR family transcriptional regulator
MVTHPTPQSRDERRSQLLDVAMALFAEKGYHRTSISDIIAAASVARGTFYNYFHSKRDLLEELLEELFETVSRAAVPIVVGEAREVHAQVRDNIAALCATLVTNLPLARVLLVQTGGLDAEANTQLRGFYDRVLTRLQAAIEAGQARGFVREGDSSVLATCVLGMVKETLYQRLLGTRRPHVDDVADEVYAVLARGLLVAAPPATPGA